MKSTLYKWEIYLFFLVVIFNLFPVLSCTFFPTLDGPSHLHNSQMIGSLLFDENPALSKFYTFNNQPVPNWSGHFILAALNLFLPAFIAEKLFLAFYVIGLPLAFRSLIKTFSTNNILISYLVFPFIYTSVLFLGFYNFSISIVFLFIALNFWVKNIQNHNELNLRSFFILSFFTLLIYFSHIFIFGIFLLLAASYILYTLILDLFSDNVQIKVLFLKGIRMSFYLFGASIIPIILMGYYFYLKPTTDESVYLEWTNLFESLKSIRPLIALSEPSETPYTSIIFYSFCFLVITVMVLGLKNGYTILKNTSKPIQVYCRGIFKKGNYWFFVMILTLILYFTLPDSDGFAGYVSSRLALLFYLFLIIWIAQQNIPLVIGILTVTISIYVSFNRVTFFTSEIQKLNIVAKDCNEVSNQIPPHSTVLPVNFSNNWLHLHFSNYLGIDRPLIILENYECNAGYFPLQWNLKSVPNMKLVDRSITDFPCIQSASNTQNNEEVIEYVFTLGKLEDRDDSCYRNFKEILRKDYFIQHQTENCRIYKIKNH